MNDALRQHNAEIVRRLVELQSAISRPCIPELEPYRQRLHALCAYVSGMAAQNVADLDCGGSLVIEDVVSNTSTTTQLARLLSARFATPLLRANDRDRLGLRILAWLHREHAVTAHFPAAFTSGDTGVWPMTSLMPIYSLPLFEQETLLFQPLFFHEFGHLLYACHSKEMDDLVSELQRQLDQLLAPPSRRNDSHDRVRGSDRRKIVARWHTWTQELFCDAIGLVVGGPAFLYAFSDHLSTMSSGDFYQDQVDLQNASHPVTWLRIRLLSSRARGIGWKEVADHIENSWEDLAHALGIGEDYHGFYDDRFQTVVQRCLDDMLTEVEPRRCSEEESAGHGSSLVSLLNLAWLEFRRAPQRYVSWEAGRISELLSRDE